MNLSREELLYLAYRADLRNRPDLLAGLFPKQRACVSDEASLIAAICTRRAGKSFGGGSILYNTGYQFEGATVPYISLTRRSAKNIMWPVMKKIKALYGLEADLKDSALEVHLPNGAIIPLLGADQENFIERLRGGAYPFVMIDEAQAFRSHLQELVEDVLGPSMLDYSGKILLAGTPGPSASGYFFEATQARHGFSVHKWSVLDNPHLPHAAAYIEKLKRDKGWTDQNPTYRREWLGEWVEDPDAMVYKYGERNDYGALPEGYDWHRILAVDYGFNDQTAFGIVAYCDSLPHVFVEHVEGHTQWIPSQVAARLTQLIERFRPVKIVADTGGLGKSITEEMIRRYQIPMHAAQKTDKLTWISLVNGAFIDNTLHVQRDLTKLKDQYKALIRDEKGMEDPTLPNDLCDVVLYGYREAKGYSFTPKEDLTPESKLEKDILQSLENSLRSKDELEWFER
jgi:hypothetical protein